MFFRYYMPLFVYRVVPLMSMLVLRQQLKGNIYLFMASISPQDLNGEDFSEIFGKEIASWRVIPGGFSNKLYGVVVGHPAMGLLCSVMLQI